MFAHIALPLPVFHTFTYRVPEEERERAVPGARVLVPFGRRERIGWIDRVEEESSVARVREIHGVIDERPSAPAPLTRGNTVHPLNGDAPVDDWSDQPSTADALHRVSDRPQRA